MRRVGRVRGCGTTNRAHASQAIVPLKHLLRCGSHQSVAARASAPHQPRGEEDRKLQEQARKVQEEISDRTVPEVSMGYGFMSRTSDDPEEGSSDQLTVLVMKDRQSRMIHGQIVSSNGRGAPDEMRHAAGFICRLGHHIAETNTPIAVVLLNIQKSMGF